MDNSPPGSSVHGIPGKNTEVECHVLFQGIFLIQGLNLHLFCLLYWQVDSLPLMPPGETPKTLLALLLLSCISRVRLCVTP